MCLVGLELLVVGELHVHGASAQLRHAAAEVRHHRHRRDLLRHLQERLHAELTLNISVEAERQVQRNSDVDLCIYDQLQSLPPGHQRLLTVRA